MAKRFINSASDVVPDLKQGLSLDGSRITLVEPDEGYHIGIRTGLADGTQPRRVSVVSGGGSGHEPMALGYIGEGMLAAAVAGDVFASPAEPAIEAMLHATAQNSTGILVVIMNYQGDRLHFSGAIDRFRSKNQDIPIRMLIVDDDCSIPDSPQPRGIAGTTFVLKIAGTAADEGLPLDQVFRIAEKATKSMATYGVAMEPCTLPGSAINHERLGAEEIELGMGIHGEPGARKQSLDLFNQKTVVQDLITNVCRAIDDALQNRTDIIKDSGSLAIMINNLGAVAQSELQIVAKAVGDYLFEGDGEVLNGNTFPVHMFIGSYITSLQMNGISITCLVLPKDENSERFLLKPNPLSSWVPGFKVTPPEKRVYFRKKVLSEPSATQTSTSCSYQIVSALSYSNLKNGATSQSDSDITSTRSGGAHLTTNETGLDESTTKLIMSITTALLDKCDELGLLDSRTGDGDFGATVKTGCESLQKALRSGHLAHAAGNATELFPAIGKVLHKMGGSIGALTAHFFEGATKALRSQKTYDPLLSWRAAFIEGTQAVMNAGGAKVGDRTLVDALKPAADILSDPNNSVKDAALAAKGGCDSTKMMGKAKFGRSAHISAEQLLNYPDPGAVAVSIILDAIAGSSGD